MKNWLLVLLGGALVAISYTAYELELKSRGPEDQAPTAVVAPAPKSAPANSAVKSKTATEATAKTDTPAATTPKPQGQAETGSTTTKMTATAKKSDAVDDTQKPAQANKPAEKETSIVAKAVESVRKLVTGDSGAPKNAEIAATPDVGKIVQPQEPKGLVQRAVDAVTDLVTPAPETAEKAPAAIAETKLAAKTPDAAHAPKVTTLSKKTPVAQSTGPVVPTFDVVRVEKDGSAVIAGRAEPGSDVTLEAGGQSIGTAKASRRGEFVIIPDQPISAGSSALALVARVPGGETKKSAQVVTVAVPQTGQATMDVTAVAEAPKAPAAPAVEAETKIAAVATPKAAASGQTPPTPSAPASATTTAAAMKAPVASQPAQTETQSAASAAPAAKTETLTAAVGTEPKAAPVAKLEQSTTLTQGDAPKAAVKKAQTETPASAVVATGKAGTPTGQVKPGKSDGVKSTTTAVVTTSTGGDTPKAETTPEKQTASANATATTAKAASPVTGGSVTSGSGESKTGAGSPPDSKAPKSDDVATETKVASAVVAKTDTQSEPKAEKKLTAAAATTTTTTTTTQPAAPDTTKKIAPATKVAEVAPVASTAPAVKATNETVAAARPATPAVTKGAAPEAKVAAVAPVTKTAPSAGVAKTATASAAPATPAVTTKAAPETKVAAVAPATKSPAPPVAETAAKPATAKAPAEPLVVVSEPGQPSRVLQGKNQSTPKKPVSFDTVDYDDEGQVILAGRVAPGANVRAYLGEAHLGDATADTSGQWILRTTRNIEPGVYQLRVDKIDVGGNVLARVTAPFERSAPDAVARVRANGEIIIQPGDNLWNLSRDLYGTGTQYTVIYDANRNQISDPDLIFPGQVFMTPGAEPAAASGASSG